MSFAEDEDGYSSNYHVGSLPRDYAYGPDDAEGDLTHATQCARKRKILLMGSKGSGKSSIEKVVFHKMSPNETLFLESTNKIVRNDISNSSFVKLDIWDIPGQVDFVDQVSDFKNVFGGWGALVFVIDAQVLGELEGNLMEPKGTIVMRGFIGTAALRPMMFCAPMVTELVIRKLHANSLKDDYMEALQKLNKTVVMATKANPDMKIEVFIHKVDGLSDDHKIEIQRDIHQRATDDLADRGLDSVQLSFYLTSIYDHSIFEAFSKVLQKLIPELPTLENLLNIFISNSGIDKAFLFDVVTKMYIATDNSPVDMQSYELCCDMIDVIIDISSIYGLQADGEGSTFDSESASIIKLNNGTVLYLQEVNRFLALVCILRDENFDKQGLIDYNFQCFRQAIHEVFEVQCRTSQASGTPGYNSSADLNLSNGYPEAR